MWKRILALAITLALFSSCNIYESFDEPKTDVDVIDQALALMDEGKCGDALKLFDGKTGLDDDGYHTKGWAQMCSNGASLTNVAKTMFSYSSSSDNLTIVGTLANSMVPSGDPKITGLGQAITSFSSIRNQSVKSVNTTMGYLVKIAAILAKSSANAGDASTVTRADIGPCTTNCATCGTGAAGEMSDADATLLGQTVTAAANSGVAGMGAVGDLAARLNALFPGGSSAAVYRCLVWTKFFSN